MSVMANGEAAPIAGFVDQQDLDDCYRAAVATTLGLQIEEVPHFYREARNRPTFNGERCPEVYDMIRDWARTRGLAPLFLPTTGATLEMVLEHTKRLNPEVPFVLGGTSAFGYGHAVVVHRGEIIHDPGRLLFAKAGLPKDSGIVAPDYDGQYELTYFVTLPEWAQRVPRSEEP